MSSSVTNKIKELLKGAKGCDPKSVLYAPRLNSLKNIKKGRLLKIGKGEYGTVYYGCLDNKCKTPIAIKFTTEPSAKMEYKIADKLRGMGVPKMYHFKSCNGRDILFSEYINGVPLEKWMQTYPGVAAYKTVIRNVVSNLYAIHKKYPSFRHHDLHWNNIMITKDLNTAMVDFGFSVMDGIKNPVVNRGNHTNVGISRKSNPMYDLHYFLRIIHDYTHIKSVKEFVESLFDKKYLSGTEHLSKGRLKMMKHENLPTFQDVLNHPFLNKKKFSLPPPKPIVKVKRKTGFEKAKEALKPKLNKKTTFLNQKTAIEKAKAVLAKNKMKPKVALKRSMMLKPKVALKKSMMLKPKTPRSVKPMPMMELKSTPMSNKKTPQEILSGIQMNPKTILTKIQSKSNTPRSMNNIPLAQLYKSNTPRSMKITIDKKGDVKIGKKKCRLHKKPELIKMFGFDPKMTKDKMCEKLRANKK